MLPLVFPVASGYHLSLFLHPAHHHLPAGKRSAPWNARPASTRLGRLLKHTHTQTNKQTNQPTNQPTNQRTNERTKEGRKEGRKERTNERTNQPTNKQTNKHLQYYRFTRTNTKKAGWCVIPWIFALYGLLAFQETSNSSDSASCTKAWQASKKHRSNAPEMPVTKAI